MPEYFYMLAFKQSCQRSRGRQSGKLWLQLDTVAPIPFVVDYCAPIPVRSIANARESLNGTGRGHGHKSLRASRQNALVSGGIMVNRRA